MIGKKVKVVTELLGPRRHTRTGHSAGRSRHPLLRVISSEPGMMGPPRLCVVALLLFAALLVLPHQAQAQGTVATGAPAITGTAQVGQTLTAGIGTIADADGLPDTFPDDYTFQWIRVDGVNETDIAGVGATANTYTPVDDDEGKTLKVKVSFSDDDGNSESLTSDAYPSSGTVLFAASSCPTTDYTWCGTLTVGTREDTDVNLRTEGFGYDPDDVIERGSLSPATFTHGGTNYTVSLLWREESTNTNTNTVTSDLLTLRVDDGGDLPDGTTLTMDGRSAALTVGTDSPHIEVGWEEWNLLTLGSPPDWIDGQQVTVSLDLPPTLSTATMNGTALVLTYDEDLDDTSTPATSAYAVTVAGSDRTVSSVSIGGSSVTLTLASAVTAGETVTVSYTVPSTNPVQDAAGLDAAALTDEAVTNNTGFTNTPATGVPTITGTARVGETLTAGLGTITDADGLTTKTFPNDYTFQWVQVDGGSETAISGATDQTYTLASSDEGKTVKVTVSFTDDDSNSEARTSAAFPATGTIQESDTLPPVLSTTTVNGTALVLTYDEALDDTSVPAASAYGVTVAGSDRTVASVSISGAAVTLTLASAVTAGETVTVSYTVPGTNPVQDAAGNDAAALTDQAVTNTTGGTNNAATGAPAISGTARVGQTLTASTSGIADADGLTHVSYSYQWILVDGVSETNIAGARSSTYALGATTAGKKVKVKVSFTDDLNYAEELTSAAYPASGTIEAAETTTTEATETKITTEAVETKTQAPPPKLTAGFRDVPAGHDGTTAFTVLIAFSERIRTTPEQMQQAVIVTGGTVTSAQEVSGLGDRWEITVTPNSDDAVRISLPPTTSCFAAGAICSSNDSKKLERGIAVSIARVPLTASFAEVPEGHYGPTPFTLHLAFSEPVATTAAALEQALTVANATITSVQQVDDRSDLWEITVMPDSNLEVRLSLPSTTACADDNAVCTAGGLMLSEGIAASIARAPLTAYFECVPEGHIGIPFTLQLAFSEPIRITAAALTQALTVTGGRMTSVRRVDNRNDLWEIQIHPDAADVSISLPSTTSCGDEGAICTQDDVALHNNAQADIPFSGYLMPHTLNKVSGEDQTGPANTQLAESFVVVASDEEGTAMAGVIVTFTVSAGGGMLSANTDADPCTFESSKTSITSITDANGQAATRLTLGSELGTNTVDIAVAGLEPEPFTATTTEQTTPHTLATVCGEDQEGTAGERLAKPFVVFVSDEDGAAITGVTVAFVVITGGGTLSATIETTHADGYARTWLTLGSELGTNTVTATVEGLDPVTFTATGQESSLASLLDVFRSGGKLLALPDSPQLAQNAPNPFNSQTVLAYFLPEAGAVRLEVFSLTGQRVAVLHHGLQQAGFHQLRWDGRDDAGRSVASGLYLYRLVTDETVLTRKLMLLR